MYKVYQAFTPTGAEGTWRRALLGSLVFIHIGIQGDSDPWRGQRKLVLGCKGAAALEIWGQRAEVRQPSGNPRAIHPPACGTG